MAIELGRINVNDLAENNYKSLGIGFGRKSNSNGIFAVNYTTLTQAKDNLINLILTKKGEREMQPEFGCDIHNLIFEQIVEDSIAADIENSILDAVNTWLPYINVDNIIFDYDDNDIDTNSINLQLQLSLKSNPALTETLNVSINN
jgi:phage baseplate assembly protein W